MNWHAQQAKQCVDVRGPNLSHSVLKLKGSRDNRTVELKKPLKPPESRISTWRSGVLVTGSIAVVITHL